MRGNMTVKKTRDLTEGSVFKNIIYFSLPYLLSYFMQTLYGMADLYIIGQYEGVASTTAVSVGSQVMQMVTVIIVGLAMGVTVAIGQAVGAKNKKAVGENIGASISLFLVISVAAMVIFLLLRAPIVSVMSTPDEAVEGTKEYLTVCFIGIPFITAYNVIASIFRGMGDSKSPMYFIAVACVSNIVLDYVFIGALGLGAMGAALGTTVAQTISVIVSLVVIIKRPMGITLKKENLKPRRKIMGKIVRVGVPISLQDGLIQVAFIAITIIANQRGLNDAAAVGIVEKIISFLFLVPSTMLAVVSALGAQNIGASKPKRARETMVWAIVIAVSFGLIIAVLMQFLSENVVRLFTTATDADEVVRLGGEYMRSYVWDVVFAGIHFSFSGYFCAIGKSYLSFIHNITSIALVRIPGVYLMSIKFPNTLYPMGFATVVASFVSVIICVIMYVSLNRGPRAAQRSEHDWGEDDA